MKGSSERWPKRCPNDDHFVSFWVLTDTCPQRAQNGCLAGKKIFYSFSLLLLLVLLLLLLFFQSLAHFMSTNTKPSGTIGDTQKNMTISATSFRGCKRFSPLLIWFTIQVQYDSDSECDVSLLVDMILFCIIVVLPSSWYTWKIWIYIYIFYNIVIHITYLHLIRLISCLHVYLILFDIYIIYYICMHSIYFCAIW